MKQNKKKTKINAVNRYAPPFKITADLESRVAAT